MSELKDEKGINIVFPDKNDLMNFQINISPFDGYYKDGTFTFECKVPNTYPHEAPKILCTTRREFATGICGPSSEPSMR